VRLLLDTHILLWAAGKDERLSPAARRLLEGTGNELVFSAASLWEVALKRQSGKSDFGAEPAVLRRTLLESGYVELPITGMHVAATSALPKIHKDPFDRLLLAQALTEGMTLVTADKVLSRYPGAVTSV
jgi:PIN domain nuclease of toxin-antitoxin system